MDGLEGLGFGLGWVVTNVGSCGTARCIDVILMQVAPPAHKYDFFPLYV